MLKRVAIDKLQAGMILGRTVYKEDMSALLEEGTELTALLIQSLQERGVASVLIFVEDKKDENEPPISIPDRSPNLDPAYVEAYGVSLEEVRGLFEAARRNGKVDVQKTEQLTDNVLPLASGAKAVTHLHNMASAGDYLLHHSLHVAILAGLMGNWLHMPKTKRRRLVTAGLLMDVGNLRLAPDLLAKRAPLLPEERRLMQKHPTLGYEMITGTELGQDWDIAHAILQHHERDDGSGYPNGTKKAEIDEFARILAILDMYDAMGTDRPYAKRRSPFDAFRILSDDVLNSKLDARFGFTFIRKVSHSLHGCWVSLTNGVRGKIIYIDEARLTSLPVVQTETGDFIDLNDRKLGIRIDHLLTSREVDEHP